jgi:hypothetical protein
VSASLEGMTTYTARPIEATALKELRSTDDAGCSTAPFVDNEGSAPLLSALQRAGRTHRPGLVCPAARLGGAAGAQPGAYDEQGPVCIHTDECTVPALTGHPFEW